MWAALRHSRDGNPVCGCWRCRRARHGTGGDFLNLWPWSPGGYISPAEERADTYRTRQDPLYQYQAYATRAAHTIDRGDEVFGGSPYRYVPVDLDALREAQANRLYAVTGLVDEPEPATPQWPAIGSLVESAYGSLNDLWQRIAGEQVASNDW